MRLVSLQELDYSDITYNIPHALIFGALEPSVGITLACIPLLRPLLGRTKYSGNGTAKYNASSEHANDAVRGNGGKKNGFAPLEDDSSQYQLRPVGHKHGVMVSTVNGDGVSDTSDQQSLAREDDGGITVKKQWRITRSE